MIHTSGHPLEEIPGTDGAGQDPEWSIFANLEPLPLLPAGDALEIFFGQHLAPAVQELKEGGGRKQFVTVVNGYQFTGKSHFANVLGEILRDRLPFEVAVLPLELGARRDTDELKRRVAAVEEAISQGVPVVIIEGADSFNHCTMNGIEFDCVLDLTADRPTRWRNYLQRCVSEDSTFSRAVACFRKISPFICPIIALDRAMREPEYAGKSMCPLSPWSTLYIDNSRKHRLSDAEFASILDATLLLQ